MDENYMPKCNEVLTKRSDTLNWVCINASVPRGLEEVAVEIIRNTLDIDANDITFSDNYVYFNLEMHKTDQIKKLRCVNNTAIMVHYFNNLKFENEEDTQKIISIIMKTDFKTSFFIWKDSCNFCGIYDSTKIKYLKALKTTNIRCAMSNITLNRQYEFDILRFKIIYRYDCTIVNTAVCSDLTAFLIKYLQQNYHWVYDNTCADIDINLIMFEKNMIVTFQLFNEVKHHKFSCEYGLERLLPPMAEIMLYLCHVKTGNIVLDPICGYGTIIIQAMQGPARETLFAVDKNSKHLKKLNTNINFILSLDSELERPSLSQGNARNIYFDDRSVNVICTQFVFSKYSMHGDFENYYLKKYSEIMHEFARVLTFGGRACIVVDDSGLMLKVIKPDEPRSPWKLLKMYNIDTGDIKFMFLVSRKKRVAKGPNGDTIFF